MDTAKYTNLRQLAIATGLPMSWLRDEAAAGRLPSVRAGRRLMFDLDEVLAALKTKGPSKPERHAAVVLLGFTEYARRFSPVAHKTLALAIADGHVPHFKFGRCILLDPNVANPVVLDLWALCLGNDMTAGPHGWTANPSPDDPRRKSGNPFSGRYVPAPKPETTEVDE